MTKNFDELQLLGEEIGREARDPAELDEAVRTAVSDARNEVVKQIDVLLGTREAPEAARAGAGLSLPGQYRECAGQPGRGAGSDRALETAATG